MEAGAVWAKTVHSNPEIPAKISLTPPVQVPRFCPSSRLPHTEDLRPMLPTSASIFTCKMGMPLPVPPCLPCWVAVWNKWDRWAWKGPQNRQVRYTGTLPSLVIQEKYVQPDQHQWLHHPQKHPGWKTPSHLSLPSPHLVHIQGVAKTLWF